MRLEYPVLFVAVYESPADIQVLAYWQREWEYWITKHSQTGVITST